MRQRTRTTPTRLGSNKSIDSTPDYTTISHMKLLVHGFFCLLLGGVFLAGCSTAPRTVPAAGGTQPNAEVARFHVGETVSIIFSGIPDPIEPHEETIKEDGNINLSLIGLVKAVGKTAGELQNEIHDLYVPKYYVRLTVVVKPGDLIYYVRGEIKQPGREIYIGETTVTKAITSAGDFTDFASHNVRLIRANGEVIKVDVDKALEDPELDPKVYPGDQVVVPRRIF
jgi:protein involved in polysaccharide export with SLBB domain